jgi:chromatin assembly factor 1 subunit B
LSNMNPPTNIPGSRRSSFSSAAANSPLLTATTGLRAGRSPSPVPLPAIRPSTSMPLTTQSMNQKLYRDELATNFFRRLTFAPDGSLLLTPAGQIEESIFPTPFIPDGGDRDKVPGPKSSDTSKPNDASKSTVYIYARSNLNRPPIAHLPGHQSTTVAVRFSPIFYELRNITGPPAEPKKIILDKKNPDPVQVSLNMPPPPPPSAAGATVKEKIGPVAGSSQPQQAGIFALPYRLMFAVAAQDSVLLYDTQQSGPIAIFKGLHYSAFTDVAW